MSVCKQIGVPTTRAIQVFTHTHTHFYCSGGNARSLKRLWPDSWHWWINTNEIWNVFSAMVCGIDPVLVQPFQLVAKSYYCCLWPALISNFTQLRNKLQSRTAWRMEEDVEKISFKEKIEQQHLHEERDISKAEGNIQYLKGWRLRQPLQHKLIWSATTISRVYQGKQFPCSRGVLKL